MNDALAGSTTVADAGAFISLGTSVNDSTVSVAGAVSASPTALLKSALYCQPLSDTFVASTFNVSVAFPASVVSAANDEPPLVETSHCTLGAGTPDASAVNDAAAGSTTVADAGLFVIFGASVNASTVSVAGAVSASPTAFLNRALYCQPLSETFVASTLSVSVVFPASVVSGANEEPPLVETSHCTLGAGTPDASAVNDADPRSTTVVASGLFVTFGGSVTLPRSASPPRWSPCPRGFRISLDTASRSQTPLSLRP